ncbi:MAG TPA: hypothetical protein VF168_10020 [Trueperaceae bacterium]
MSASETWLLLLTIGAVTACLVLLLSDSLRWVALYEAPGHRPEALLEVASALRRAHVGARVKNTVTVGSEAAIGAGMSTTLLVLKRDLPRARRVVAEARRMREARSPTG